MLQPGAGQEDSMHLDPLLTLDTPGRQFKPRSLLTLDTPGKQFKPRFLLTLDTSCRQYAPRSSPNPGYSR